MDYQRQAIYQEIANNPVEYLIKGLLWQKRIDGKRNEIGVLRSLAESDTPSYSGMPGSGGSGDKVCDCALSLVDAERELLRLCTVQTGFIADINAVIVELVTEVKLQEVLLSRYCRLWNWSSVAFEMGISQRWALSLHARALEQMKVNALLKVQQGLAHHPQPVV